MATDAGDLRGAFVCLAAGSGTSTLTKELGYEIEVTQDPGLLFTASVPRSILKHIIYAADSISDLSATGESWEVRLPRFLALTKSRAGNP